MYEQYTYGRLGDLSETKFNIWESNWDLPSSGFLSTATVEEIVSVGKLESTPLLNRVETVEGFGLFSGSAFFVAAAIRSLRFWRRAASLSRIDSVSALAAATYYDMQ